MYLKQQKITAFKVDLTFLKMWKISKKMPIELVLTSVRLVYHNFWYKRLFHEVKLKLTDDNYINS